MTDYVFDLMRCFPDSRIRSCGEVILDNKGTMCFTVKGVQTNDVIVYKLLEWCSRPIAKGEPYSSERRNREWRASLLLSFNLFLHTSFTLEDMYVIYDRLGNGINRDRTVKFVESNFDMGALRDD